LAITGGRLDPAQSLARNAPARSAAWQ